MPVISTEHPSHMTATAWLRWYLPCSREVTISLYPELSLEEPLNLVHLSGWESGKLYLLEVLYIIKMLPHGRFFLLFRLIIYINIWLINIFITYWVIIQCLFIFIVFIILWVIIQYFVTHIILTPAVGASFRLVPVSLWNILKLSFLWAYSYS